MAGIKYIFKNISRKHRLSLSDPSSKQEMWHMFISPLTVIFSLISVIIVLFIVVAITVVYTPILDMIPGYPGNKSRNLLLENIIRLDLLEAQVESWDNYRQNISIIMDGKTPVSLDNKINDSARLAKESISRSELDSILRKQMENPGEYKLQSGLKTSEATFELFQPTKGVVATQFDPKNGMLGISIASPSDQEVVSVLDGTIFYSGWSPETGNTVHIQHSGNMITIYGNLARIIKKTGERVKAGEVIGLTSTTDLQNPSKGANLHFELWYNGTPVNPENYIIF